MTTLLSGLLLLSSAVAICSGFFVRIGPPLSTPTGGNCLTRVSKYRQSGCCVSMSNQQDSESSVRKSRRGFLSTASSSAGLAAALGLTSVLTGTCTKDAALAIGELPEFADQPRFVQHAVINVPDLEAAVDFYVKGLGMEVLRKREDKQTETAFVGFGPEKLKIPKEWTVGVSSFRSYGGHFSLELVQQKREKGGEGEQAQDLYDPGNGLRYLQMGVEEYRISKVIDYGGTVLFGFGYLLVEAPGGLKLQIFSGSRPDPFMFPVLTVKDMKKSRQWYKEVLGMQEFAYPHVRPALDSPFEPPKPNGAILLAYDATAAGVVLVPPDKKQKTITPGSVWDKMAILATDVQENGALLNSTSIACGGSGALYVGKAPGTDTTVAVVKDPDGYAYVLVEYSDWAKEQP